MKKFVGKIARRLGIDVLRFTPPTSVDVRILTLLTKHNIDLVFDVGANVGQYASMIFNIGYKGKIISFEPLSSAYDKLLQVSKFNPNWEVAERCAIGDMNGYIKINISENSVSSSILSILKRHVDAKPDSAYIGSDKVKICKLDKIAPYYLKDAKAPFLKIDAQGYEEKVLDGALKILPKIKGIQSELSLVPLYEGQMLFEDIWVKIRRLGFNLYDLFPSFVDKQTGQILQVDGIFFRD